MQIFVVAIFVVRHGVDDVVYVGDAIEIERKPWLVLTWDSADKLIAVEKLPLDEDKLVREPPVDLLPEADWHYVVPMGEQPTLQ